MSIDEKILDEIIPIPDRDELKESIQEALDQEGFSITNFRSGGIFYTLMMILIQIRIEIVKLLRVVLNNMFARHAEGTWMELKAGDFSKKRKQPVKARGYVMLKRNAPGDVVKVAMGDVFKTEMDINGEELRFLAVEDTIMQKDSLSQKVLVEAENAGSIYNVPPAQIKKSLTHIEGVDEITNEVGWIVQEGSDLEEIESLRDRVLNSWAELSTLPIRDKYKNVCEAVSGVLFVRVDDLHPRGQGTIDIIVTSTAGAASELLLDAVRVEADKIKGPYDNILVKSSDVVVQDIAVTITIYEDADDTGLEARAITIITELLKIKKERKLNELTHSDINFALRKNVSIIKNVKVTIPENDVLLPNDKVIIPGVITISILRG